MREVHSRLWRGFVVVNEGVKDESDAYVSTQPTEDAIGNPQLGGVTDYLQQFVTQELGMKARYNKLDMVQQNVIYLASRSGDDEVYRCGQEAVRQA